MVVTAQHLATEVGVDVLKRGGNAIDAAVAVGYALAVVYPAAGNLGGGGFMTIQLADGRKTFIDFREKAPLAATSAMFLDKDGNVVKGLSTKSFLAVGVPGSVAGLRICARQIRHAEARRPDGAGDRLRGEGLHARRRRRRDVRRRRGRFSKIPGDRGDLPEGRQALRRRADARAKRPCRHLAGDQRPGSGRVLQRPRRRRDRRLERGQSRHPRQGRS